MRSQTPKRFLVYSLLVASLTMSVVARQQQERKAAPIKDELLLVKGDCPRPIALTLTASNPTSFDPADFAQGQINAPHMTGLGDTSIDKNFLYTFKWRREERCCQITRARLTVNMKSNQGGQSSTSADSGNDGIALMHLGSAVAPYNESVYSNVSKPFGVGQAATKTWDLTGAALNNINASSQLSFAVQDETRVESATLQLWGCCLTTPGKNTAVDTVPNPRN